MKPLKFKTTILQSGNNTGIVVPEEIVLELGAGKKPPVKVTMNQYTYRNTIATMGGKFMIAVSAEVRKLSGVKGGDTLEVTLELDAEPRTVSLPADLEKELDKNPKAKAFYETLSYSNRQRYVLPIGQAKSEETRMRRIAKMINDLQAGKK
jgi:bacteriocin resistance YdeI/OmpD-like protein/uncharacterized protein DUF1905